MVAAGQVGSCDPVLGLAFGLVGCSGGVLKFTDIITLYISRIWGDVVFGTSCYFKYCCFILLCFFFGAGVCVVGFYV